MAEKKKAGSLVRKLNLRLTLRQLALLVALDAALFAFAYFVLNISLTMGELGYVLLLTLGAEALLLLLGALQNSGIIRETLQPLTDLTAATQVAVAQSSVPDPDQLSDLADRLERIDASQLDTRLPVAENAELKELTEAINAMLARLDAAYAAQIKFVDHASHELRTPIAVIQGYANLLDRWGKDDPQARQEAIDAIIAEGEAMKNLVEQLLFLARGDNHTMRVKPEALDATEVAAQVLKETALVDQTHPLSADWNGSVTLTADPDLLKECLRILVDNAVKYTPEGGRITLKIRQEGTTVRLSVIDEGVGVAKEDLPHVFDRFYRADASRARQTGGSGLGLSIAERIAQTHGGHLEVASAPGLGSKFTLVLPLTAK